MEDEKHDEFKAIVFKNLDKKALITGVELHIYKDNKVKMFFWYNQSKCGDLIQEKFLTKSFLQRPSFNMSNMLVIKDRDSPCFGNIYRLDCSQLETKRACLKLLAEVNKIGLIPQDAIVKYLKLCQEDLSNSLKMNFSNK